MSRRPRGFSLVVTLSMMVLLALLAVGLLSLSTVQLRTSGVAKAQAEARANARMGLAMAISRLQSLAGPDQRVTAPATLAGSASHPHWVGVWRTTREADSGVPLIDWETRNSALVDARLANGLTADKTFEGWLVSGDPGANPDESGGDSVRLVGPGSVDREQDEVTVPLVPLVPVGDGEVTRGAMAFWCSDESLKLSLNVPPAGDAPLADTSTGVPERLGVGDLDGLEPFGGVDDAELAKVIDRAQAGLAGIGEDEALRRHFHRIGSRASAVLADPLRGGLKRDLSVFLEKGQVPSGGSGLLPEVSPETPLLTGSLRQRQGPKLGALREFALLGSRSDGGLEVTASEKRVSAGKFGEVPDQSHFTGQPVHPVLVQAEVYTRVCYVRGYLTMHLYPRIVLWNPYNAPLESQAYTVDFNHSINDSMAIEQRQGSTTVDVVNAAYDTRGRKENRLSLTLEATSFEAGEALVFSPRPTGGAIAGLATPLVKRDVSGSNLMSAEVDPHAMTNFYIVLSNLQEKGVSSRDLPLYANHNRGSYYWVDMMDWWEGNPDNGLKVSLHLGTANSHSSRLDLPLLQLVDTDNWRRGYEGRFNNGRWRVGGVETIYDYESTSDFEPWTRGAYGFRYKWWVERNPYNYAGTGGQRYWGAAVTADYNLRAPFCHRSPYDGVTDNGEEHHWYMWGPFTCDRQQGLPYISPERASHPSDHGFRGNPFFGGASTQPGHLYPVFDVPASGERIVSLGRFQHAQLTPFVWHATFPIGNSWVPPNQTRRDRSSDSPRILSRAWDDYVPHLPEWLSQEREDDVVLYDLAYEANHELWDRYFLSGARAAEKRNFLESPGAAPLANHRLVPVSAGSDGSADRLQSFYQAASEVVLAGAFNVNTTDPEVWRALFASMKGRQGDGADFPRFAEPGSGDFDPSDPYSPKAWTGFRSLSDEQLERLAAAVAEQVRERGPFISVSDFVNRRLVRERGRDSDQGLMGALQQAIADAGINDSYEGGDTALVATGYGSASYEPGSDSREWAPADHLRSSKAAGMPSYLQQGDLLQALGPMLVARGDTFVVRAYGEARSPEGKVLARAWCEAEIQRLPSYLDGADAAEEPPFASDGSANDRVRAVNRRFGRRFETVSFRWMSPSEI